jgi:predicted nuclease of predicted toxin-antitoxin system
MILVDQNISHRIVSMLGDIWVDMSHVKMLGLTNANDYSIFM